jgi:hypothetical protein
MPVIAKRNEHVEIFAVTVAEVILAIVGTYLGLGFVFALAFAAWGATTFDDAANKSPLSFRLVIIPAATSLWPLLAIRWLQVRRRRSFP